MLGALHQLRFAPSVQQQSSRQQSALVRGFTSPGWHGTLCSPCGPRSFLQCHLTHQVRTSAAAQPRAVVSLG